MVVLLPVVISNGLRAAIACMGAKSNPPPQPPSAASVHCMHIHIFNIVKTMNAKNTKTSPIHKNADADITCDFGDGDIRPHR